MDNAIELANKYEGEIIAADSSMSFLPPIKAVNPMTNEFVNGTVPDLKLGDLLYGQNDNLGNHTPIRVGPRRSKSILIVGGSLEKQSYDPSSEDWKIIKDYVISDPQVQTRLTGFEFLIWLYARQAFGLLFLKGHAKKVEYPRFLASVGKDKILTTKREVYEKKKQTWWNPRIEDVADEDLGANGPTEDQLAEVIQHFAHPELDVEFLKNTETTRPR